MSDSVGSSTSNGGGVGGAEAAASRGAESARGSEGARGLGSAERAEVSRAVDGVDAKAVGAEAARVSGAAAAIDGFEKASGAGGRPVSEGTQAERDRRAAEAGARPPSEATLAERERRAEEAKAERPITEPSRIATVDAPKMTVNTDGAGPREGAHYQAQTAFQVKGEYLNAQSQSFLALRPQELPAGAKMGDPVEITIKGGRVYDEATKRDRVVPDQTVYGILGDKKGRGHEFAVEGSKRLHELLGSTGSARSGTIAGEVSVRVAVGAGKGLVGTYGSGPGRIPSEAEIQDYAQRVFAGR
jgi:hypothetical protein